MSACRTCNTTIVWATTEHGKRIPLEPAQEDTIALFVLRGWQAVAVSPALFDDEPKYVYHQCPPAYDPATAEIPY